jgi:anti-sigma B factor antagonist
MQAQDTGAPGFAVRTVDSDGRAELALVGELDMASAPQLLHAVDALIAAGQRMTTLDLSALTFCDSSGISALIQVRAAMVQVGGELSVVGVTGLPLRALQVTGLLQMLTGSSEQPKRQV